MNGEPVPAVAVSPKDQSSDRVQSDADQAALIGQATAITDQADTNRAQADADQVITVDRLDRLIAASELLSDSAVDVADATRQEMQTAHRARRRFMVTMFLMVIFTFALLVPLLVIAVQGVNARDHIQDCTAPTGKCFMEEQARLGKIIHDLERVTILANVCSVDPALPAMTAKMRTVAVQKCIEVGLK